MSDKQTGKARYELVASKSRFTVQAFASGLLSGFGHNPTIAIDDFTGEVRFTPETFEDASLKLIVKANSLRVIDDIKDKDRREIENAMFDEVLETGRYTEINFQSTNITIRKISDDRFKAKIIGDLTLHGVTQNGLWIMAQVNKTDDGLRAQGDFTLKQSDYKIKPVSVAGGALKLKDELKFSFDIAARRKQS